MTFQIDRSAVPADAVPAVEPPGPRRARIVLDEYALLRMLGAAAGESIRSVTASSDPPRVELVVDSPQVPPAALGEESRVVSLRTLPTPGGV